MPAIQAMRSDAMALRSKEDIQEKIPSFYNSVNQALGQSIVQGQDAAEQLITSRFEAANKIAAELRQKLDGEAGLTEKGLSLSMKIVNNTVQTVLSALGKTQAQEITDIVTSFSQFLLEQTALKQTYDAAIATYAQWTVQAGYTGNGSTSGVNLPDMRAMGGRGAIKYRDALTPRWTDRRGYAGNAAIGGSGYDTFYAWGSVGSVTRIGHG
jgi:hypothetical protein